MSREDYDERQLCDDWNKRFPPGTRCTASYSDGSVVEFVTAARAGMGLGYATVEMVGGDRIAVRELTAKEGGGCDE